MGLFYSSGSVSITPKNINAGGGGEPTGNKLLDDLISYIPMDEGTGIRADSHASNDLSDNNTVLSRTGVNGTTAADFNNVLSEWLSLSHGSAGDFEFLDTDFTIAFWAIWDIAGGSPMIFKYGSSGNRSYAVTRNSDSTVSFIASANGTAVTDLRSSALGEGTWRPIVAVHDSVNNLLKLSISGGAFLTTAHSGGVFNDSNDFLVGRFSSSFLNGGMQKLAIAGRAWDTDDVAAYNNSGDGLVYADFQSS